MSVKGKDKNQGVNRKRTQIDFRPTRGHADADLIYTVLMHYNRGGATDMNASQLITVSYTNYDPSETEEITKFLDIRTRSRAFARQYGISRKSDIIKILDSKFFDSPVFPLFEPDKKFVCFDTDDPNVLRLCETLDAVRYRDRGILINMWLYQYFAHGNCDFYNRLCAANILSWLKEEKAYMSEVNTSRLKTVINCLWANSCDFKENENEAAGEDIRQEEEERDELRVLMGITEACRNTSK